MSSEPRRRLRVAFLAGTLARGGAETQLTYMVRALSEAGADVRVYCLTRGEFFEAELIQTGVRPVWIGRRTRPLLRVAAFARALWAFRPHIVQAAHFYTNLYVSAVAKVYGALGIGAIRNDACYDVSSNGRWGPWLLRMPEAVLANSYAAKRNAEALGAASESLYVVPNVIDLHRFDRFARDGGVSATRGRGIGVISVASHVPAKRLERFLAAIALARSDVPSVRGVLVGDGPEHNRLQAIASDLHLVPADVRFLGRRGDVPALLGAADMLLVTSHHEGFPNVILEAMASRLPVITTPAGDAALVVQDGVTGYVVPFDEVGQMAERVVQLARSPDLRRRFGEAGRERAARLYSYEGLASALLAAYGVVAQRYRHRQVLKLLPA